MCEDGKSLCDNLQPPGLRNAQYSFYGRPYNGILRLLLAPERIGAGFAPDAANRLDDAMSKLVDRFYPKPRFFSSPVFGIELRLPSYIKNGTSQVGDIILLPFSTPPTFGAGGSASFIDTHIAGQVTRVDDSGFPVEVQDRTGIVDVKKPYFVFPSTQFDIPAARAELQKRDQLFMDEGYWGTLHGSYDPARLAHVLREHLLPLPVELPSRADVSRILGVDLDEVAFLEAVGA